MRTLHRMVLLGVASAAIGTGADADIARRVGFYQWSGVHGPAAGNNFLTAARERATALGSRVFRLYVGARFDYVHPVYSAARFEGDSIEGLSTPAKIMALPRYRAVLEDPALETVWLTVYTARNYGAGPDDLSLLRPWGEAERATEFGQISELCRWLYGEFGDMGKTIVIANNEADEKLLEIAQYTREPDLAVRNLVEWINARQAAVEAVRGENRGARLRLAHAFEISLVNLRVAKVGGRFLKTAAERIPAGERGWGTLRDVVPMVRFDLLSYSAYESANSPYLTGDPDVPAAETAGRMRRDLDMIRSQGQASLSDFGRKEFGRNFVAVGELGYARDRFEQLASGGVLPRMYHALRTALEWGAPYVVLWQVFDAPRLGGEPWGYGVYSRYGKSPALKAAEGGCDSLEKCLGAAFKGGMGAWGDVDREGPP